MLIYSDYRRNEHSCQALRSFASTYRHQALGFYQKYGYQIVGQLDDYPDGSTLYWLRKDLILAAI
jgi:hypothetical protein